MSSIKAVDQELLEAASLPLSVLPQTCHIQYCIIHGTHQVPAKVRRRQFLEAVDLLDWIICLKYVMPSVAFYESKREKVTRTPSVSESNSVGAANLPCSHAS